jgi:hypothetical protein
MADRQLAVLGLLLIAATPPPPPFFTYADRAGNRIEALAIVPDSAEEDRSALACGRDGRCALLRGDGESGQWQLHMFESRPGPDAVAARPLAVPDSAGEDERLSLWPHLVREAGGALLIGILRTRTTSYSGGGASAARLTLMRLDPGGAALVETLDAPAAGSAMVRACFTRRDERRRAGACHDQYELVGDLTLDPANADARPRFLLTTRAGPARPRSRFDDRPAFAPARPEVDCGPGLQLSPELRLRRRGGPLSARQPASRLRPISRFLTERAGFSRPANRL